MSLTMRPSEPQPRKRAWHPRRVPWGWVAQRVQEMAPDWVEVGEFSPGMATKIRQRSYPEIDPDDYEITTSQFITKDKRRRVLLYMRWLGADRQG